MKDCGRMGAASHPRAGPRHAAMVIKDDRLRHHACARVRGWVPGDGGRGHWGAGGEDRGEGGPVVTGGSRILTEVAGAPNVLYPSAGRGGRIPGR